jgi:hypothetical protein
MWALFLFKALDTIYCDINKESNNIPDEERVLLLFMLRKYGANIWGVVRLEFIAKGKQVWCIQNFLFCVAVIPYA